MNQQPKTSDPESDFAAVRTLLRALGDDPNNPYRNAPPTEVRVPRRILILCLQTGAKAILELTRETRDTAGVDPKEVAQYALAGLGALGILAVAHQLESDDAVTTIQLVPEAEK